MYSKHIHDTSDGTFWALLARVVGFPSLVQSMYPEVLVLCQDNAMGSCKSPCMGCMFDVRGLFYYYSVLTANC